MYIKQISVYLENVNGSLFELTELLGKNSINLLALSVADTTGFGIVRIIVKSGDVESALTVLRENGFIAKENSVICIRIPHKPMSFSGILKILGDGGISVEYAYSFCRSTIDDAVMIIRPSDREKAAELLEENGVTTVNQEQVDSF